MVILHKWHLPFSITCACLFLSNSGTGFLESRARNSGSAGSSSSATVWLIKCIKKSMAWIAVKKIKHIRFVRNSDWNYLRILLLSACNSGSAGSSRLATVWLIKSIKNSMAWNAVHILKRNSDWNHLRIPLPSTRNSGSAKSSSSLMNCSKKEYGVDCC